MSVIKRGIENWTLMGCAVHVSSLFLLPSFSVPPFISLFLCPPPPPNPPHTNSVFFSFFIFPGHMNTSASSQSSPPRPDRNGLNGPFGKRKSKFNLLWSCSILSLLSFSFVSDSSNLTEGERRQQWRLSNWTPQTIKEAANPWHLPVEGVTPLPVNPPNSFSFFLFFSLLFLLPSACTTVSAARCPKTTAMASFVADGH